jgi:branched-chain amino acid transport system substrate-binding protein
MKAWMKQGGAGAALVALVGGALGGPAAADNLRIGFLATLSGPGGPIGEEVWNGFALGVDQAGGKLGGAETQIVKIDDQLKPDIGLQETKRLIEKEKVQIVTGLIFSNVLMAMYPPAIESKTIVISANAGPSPIAGKLCSPYFFATSWQNDQMHSTTGAYVQQLGIKSAYLMAPNYQAGKDAIAGFKRTFSGKIVDEVYTAVGQPDYAAEITGVRAAKPDSLFVFYPGGMGISFVKQYAQYGLAKDIPLYSAFTVDHVTLPALGDAAIGAVTPTIWTTDLDNQANRKFIDGYRKKHNKLPSMYAVQGYDAAQMIDVAVRSAGDPGNAAALLSGMKAAKFDSPRGPFTFGNNNFPVQNFYMGEVVKLPDGTLDIKTKARVFEQAKDAYHADCKL